VQKLLAKNLWLLDPAWDRGTELPSVEKAIKTQLNSVNATLSQDEKDCRLDIRYKKTSNKHIIIELKKAKRSVKSVQVLEQMRKYHSAMKKVLDKQGDHDPFEMIVLIGKPLDEKDVHKDTYDQTIKMFNNFDTRIMFYEELISNAERMYSDFIKKNKLASRLVDRFIKNDETIVEQ
jgi:hypothetical protein